MHVKKIYRNEAAEGPRFNKESVGSTAETWLKMALAEFNGNPSRYEDGYEIEDLIDAIGIDGDELEEYEKELDYVVSGLAKAGFEML